MNSENLIVAKLPFSDVNVGYNVEYRFRLTDFSLALSETLFLLLFLEARQTPFS